MNKVRTHLFLTSFVMFGLQILFVRGFKLFFTQVDAQALLPWSFLGISLGCFLPLFHSKIKFSKDLRWAFLFVGIVLFLYGFSCLFLINSIVTFLMVALANIGLGYCLASLACNMEAYRFYALDFLGGIIGAIVAYLLPTYTSLEAAYCFFALLTFVPALPFKGKTKILKTSVVALLALLTVVLALNPYIDLTEYGALYQRPMDYKINPWRHGQLAARKDSYKRVLSSWSSASRLETYEKTYDDGKKETMFFLNNIDFFSFSPWEPRTSGTFGKDKRALVIGAGGGLEMRFLRDQGYTDITGVEISEDIHRVMLGRFSEGADHIFRQSHYIRGEGRNYIESHPDKFDVIVINYIGAIEGMVSANDDLTENYLFTKEAFSTYYKKLNPGGVVVIGLVYSENPAPNPHLIRATESVSETLKSFGEKPEDNIWIFGLKRTNPSFDNRGYRGLLVFRKGEASPGEENFVRDAVTGLYLKNAHLVARPGDVNIQDPKIVGQEKLAQQAIQTNMVEKLKNEFGVDVSPVPDARPYFFFYDISKKFPLERSRGIFWAACAVLFGIMAFLFRDKQGVLQKKSQVKLLAMSAMLGLTYGLFEIALLNAFTIAFSSLLWNFGMMVFGLLLGSALAGFAGGYIPQKFRLALVLVGASALFFLFNFDLQGFMLLWKEELTRSVLLIGMTLVISFCLSMLYPQLLKQCEGLDSRLPGFLLGINSVFFILGCVICRYVAFVWTLRHTFLLAGIIYILVTVFFILDNRKAGKRGAA